MWPRPVPLVGDRTSAHERAGAPDAWQFDPQSRAVLYEVMRARRDVRRFRPDPVPEQVLERVLGAAHAAPSVGHSQPWRFLVIDDPHLRDQAARMADAARLSQAAGLDSDSARHLLDLQLEGIREAPLGVVVCCDRRAPAAGVLGRATFPDADLWSCACAIENLWLAARAEGLGVGWVTLFEPAGLAELLRLPDGVVTLGWLCLGWPDERPPEPGLERAGWSRRQPLSSVVRHNRWPDPGGEPQAPRSRLLTPESRQPAAELGPRTLESRLRAPDQAAVVAVRDDSDRLLTTPTSLGLLDRAVDRVIALGRPGLRTGTLVLVAGRHRVSELGVSAFEPSVTDDVLDAARAGQALGVVTARAAGLDVTVIDAGTATGNLRDTDPLTLAVATDLLGRGEALGRRLAAAGLVVLGEIGIGNTTVASALTASLLDLPAAEVVGLGAGADSTMIERKTQVVAAALARHRTALRRAGTDGDAASAGGDPFDHGSGLDAAAAGNPLDDGFGLDASAAGDGWSPVALLAALGGPEFALLTGVVLGTARAGGVVVLDGLATSTAALIAVRAEPGITPHLIAGQRSRERAHALVLRHLGLEPLLDLRLRAGEGAGAAFAAQLLITALHVRASAARTAF